MIERGGDDHEKRKALSRPRGVRCRLSISGDLASLRSSRRLVRGHAIAAVAEMEDAVDLESSASCLACGFESRLPQFHLIL